jgi:hypothetical protein
MHRRWRQQCNSAVTMLIIVPIEEADGIVNSIRLHFDDGIRPQLRHRMGWAVSPHS